MRPELFAKGAEAGILAAHAVGDQLHQIAAGDLNGGLGDRPDAGGYQENREKHDSSHQKSTLKRDRDTRNSGMKREVVNRLAAAVNQALKQKEVVDRLAASGTLPFIVGPDGKLYVQSGVGNLGTHSCIDLARVAADVLAMPWDHVVVSWGNTAKNVPWSCMSVGSQTTHAMTRANLAGAVDVRRKLQEIAAKDLGGAFRLLIGGDTEEDVAA